MYIALKKIYFKYLKIYQNVKLTMTGDLTRCTLLVKYIQLIKLYLQLYILTHND